MGGPVRRNGSLRENYRHRRGNISRVHRVSAFARLPFGTATEIAVTDERSSKKRGHEETLDPPRGKRRRIISRSQKQRYATHNGDRSSRRHA